MNLTALQAALLTRLGRPSTDGFFTSAVLTDCINEAVQAISVEAEWPWLQTSETINSVAGTGEYTPNANWGFTKMVYINQDYPFTYVPLETLVCFTDSGRPSLYTISENKIKIRSIPDAVYAMTHIYYKIEPLLSGGSDTPILPSQFHYAIVARAAAMAYQRINDPDGMERALSEYNQWLRRINKFRRKSSGPLRPKTTRWP